MRKTSFILLSGVSTLLTATSGAAIAQTRVDGGAAASSPQTPATGASDIANPEQAQVTPTTASAQAQVDTEQSTSVTPQDPGNGDIIVTAQRRATSADNTALTIAVIGGETLRASGAIDSTTLQNVVPGLQFSRETALNSQIYLRGIGNNIGGIAASNSVATYVDGVYISNSVQAFQRFNDVERVEVLKGPQAVLYGRNATGGALLITSKTPSFEPEASGDISYGNYDTIEGRFSASGALAGDVLAARLSARYYRNDGYFTDLTHNVRPDREKSISVRGALLLKATSNLSLTLRGDLTDGKGPNDTLKIVNADAYQFRYVPGQYVADQRASYYDELEKTGFRDTGGLGKLEWSSPIGDVTSITSYRNFKTDPTFSDLDSLGAVVFVNGVQTLSPLTQSGDIVKNRSWWHETYLATDAHRPISLIVGFNYSDEKASQLSRRHTIAAFPTNIRNSLVKAYSIYGDVTWRISDRFTIGAGVRYSDEDRDYNSQPLNFTTLAPTGAVVSNSATYHRFNPRAGIEFRRTAGELWFFNFTTGFKSGGFSESTPLDSFEPESVKSYEGGLKKAWANGWLQTNLSAFYYDYKNLQVQRLIPPTYVRQIDNADGATIYGLDAEIRARVGDSLRLSADFEYLHSRYGNLNLCNNFIGPCVLAGVPTNANVNSKGKQLQRAPEVSAVFNVDWKHELGAGEFRVHLDTKYTARTYFDPFASPQNARDPFWVVNGEVRFEPSAHIYVSLFGQNITNTLYEQHIVAGGLQFNTAGVALGPYNRLVRYAPPRTFGVRLGFNF